MESGDSRALAVLLLSDGVDVQAIAGDNAGLVLGTEVRRASGITHSYYFCAFFRWAQRLFIANEIRLRAAADIMRRLVDPGGLPRRLPLPPTPSRAWIAASSLLRCCLSCWTISSTFMPEC